MIESTGALRGRKDAAGHLQAGARKVLIDAPSDDVDVTLVPGVNDDQYDRTRHHVISMASCTTARWPRGQSASRTNLALHLFITTVHAYTASQSILDKPTRHRRRGGPGGLVMIPTGAAKAARTSALAGKMDGMASACQCRMAPSRTLWPSYLDLEEINACLDAAGPPLLGHPGGE